MASKKKDPPLSDEAAAKAAEDEANQPGEALAVEVPETPKVSAFLQGLLDKEDKIREHASDKEKERGPVRIALMNIAGGISHLRSAILQVESEKR